MKLTRLTPYDQQLIVRRLPKVVANLLTLRQPRLMCGGGFIRDCVRRVEAKDIDLFCDTPDNATECSEILISSSNGIYKSKVVTDNAITVLGAAGVIPVQFIHRWTFTDPEVLISSFDFTIAQAVLFRSAGGWHTRCSEHFYQDLAGMRLVYTKPIREEEAGGSLLRVLKFQERGYRIPMDSLAAVLVRMMRGMDWTDKTLFRDGLLNEDVALGYVIKTLREVDPLAPEIMDKAADEGDQILP